MYFLYILNDILDVFTDAFKQKIESQILYVESILIQ